MFQLDSEVLVFGSDVIFCENVRGRSIGSRTAVYDLFLVL